MNPFQQSKFYLVEHLHLAKDALHIYVALIVLFGSCILFGWKVHQWKPWLLVLLAAFVGEILDIRGMPGPFESAVGRENVKDILNTMAVPTMLLIAARYTSLFTRPRATAEATQDSSDEAQVPATPLGSERDVL
jgi:hypothetical protein